MKNEYLQILITMLALICLGLISCNTSAPEVKPQVTDGAGQEVDSIAQRSGVSGSETAPHPEDVMPYKWHVHLTFNSFTNDGIDAFYALNKRVPSTFNEYLASGIPMVIPNDYVTGEPYKHVDELDMSDTTGFTFWSDGADSCRFEFVIKNNKTGENEVVKREFTERNFRDYKTIDGVPGIMVNTEWDFDAVKRTYCMKVFPAYAYIYMQKNSGELPSNLYEMFAGMGDPVEAGWKWSPSHPNEYFEFGIDPDRSRYHTVQSMKTMDAGKPKPIYVQHMFNEVRVGFERIEGVDEWRLNTDNPPTSDIIEMQPFITSNEFYNAYLALIGE